MSFSSFDSLADIRHHLITYLYRIHNVPFHYFPEFLRSEREDILYTYFGFWDTVQLDDLGVECVSDLVESYLDVFDFVIRLGQHFHTDLTLL